MKKIIAVLIAALTISSFGLIANAAYYPGDVNNSGGEPAADDLTSLKKHLLGSETVAMPDVNEDGEINIKDLVSLKKILVIKGAGLDLTKGTNKLTDRWN